MKISFIPNVLLLFVTITNRKWQPDTFVALHNDSTHLSAFFLASFDSFESIIHVTIMERVYHNNEIFRCPYCKTKLKAKYVKDNKRYLNWGVCRCSCDEYPIIEGVYYIIKDDCFNNRRAVKQLKSKKYYLTLRICLSNSPKALKLLLILKYFLGYRFPHKIKLEHILTFSKMFSRHNAFKNWVDYNIQRKFSKDYCLTLEIAKKYLNHDDILLDIGCGFGMFSKAIFSYKGLNRLTYIGADKNFSTLLTNKYFTYQDLPLICSNSEISLPIQSGYVNKIFILDTITNIYSPKTLMKECGRVLKKNGKLFIINIYNINKRSYLWGYGINPLNLMSWMKKYFKKITFIQNQLNSNNKMVKINCITKNTFTYSCYATK